MPSVRIRDFVLVPSCVSLCLYWIHTRLPLLAECVESFNMPGFRLFCCYAIDSFFSLDFCEIDSCDSNGYISVLTVPHMFSERGFLTQYGAATDVFLRDSLADYGVLSYGFACSFDVRGVCNG